MVKYFKYLSRHRWFVFLECCKLGIPWRGLVHDLSKYRASEWFPYVAYFYGDRASRQPGVFKQARNLHFRRNAHHWQFWCDRGPMPAVYIKEMIADWRGAGRAKFGFDESKKWYSQNKHKLKVDQDTRNLIEELLYA